MTTTTKTEKPILFSTAMIRAILEGRKTQTRRIIKNAPDVVLDIQQAGEVEGYENPEDAIRMMKEVYGIKCPYDNPGNELWVRETFALHKSMNTQAPSEVPEQLHEPIFFKARSGNGLSYNQQIMGKWRPSIHMPRWASRIQLTVTDIGVERVQDISEEDAIAEGVILDMVRKGQNCRPIVYQYWDYLQDKWEHTINTEYGARPSFQTLWNSINAKRGYGWESNPWVWKVSFEVKEIKGG